MKMFIPALGFEFTLTKDWTFDSSVSFYVAIPKQKAKGRFWAKLDDVNNIEFEVKND